MVSIQRASAHLDVPVSNRREFNCTPLASLIQIAGKIIAVCRETNNNKDRVRKWVTLVGFCGYTVAKTDKTNPMNGRVHKLENWWCALLRGVLFAIPLKSKLVSTVLGSWFVDT